MTKASATERVLDLLIALINTRTRMSKEQIRASVFGYSQGDHAAFERTFERDKDLLRSMGIPLVVERSPIHEDDVGYRIDLDAYRVPSEAFTPEELGVLALASSLYDDSSWSTAVARGVTKMRGLGPVAEESVPPLQVTLRAPGEEFDLLGDAIERRLRVRFEYEPLSSPRAVREVEPWRLVAKARHWYLLGRDLDRGAPRSFRLSRIRGGVVTSSGPGAFELPSREALEAALGPRREEAASAVVMLAEGRAELLRARGEVIGQAQGADVVRVSAPDQTLLVEELTAYGADAVVREPGEVRDCVIARLSSLTAIGEVDDAG